MKLQPHHHRYKNLILFFLGLVLAILISQSQDFRQLIHNLGNFGYLGAFLAGALFTSTFTIATGALILFDLAKTLHPLLLIPLAAFGAVAGDLLIFYFIKDEVEEEIIPVYDKITGGHLKKILHTKYFAWTLPVLGAFIIISPLPDELGVSLLGISEIKTKKFLAISLISHALGMSLLVIFSTL